MKKTVKTVNGGSIIQEGSAKIEEIISKLDEPDMISFKVKSNGLGVKDKSEMAAVKAAMNEIGTNGLNGAITFKFTKKFLSTVDSASLEDALKKLHRYTNFVLNEVAKVGNIDPKAGAAIMIQRAVLRAVYNHFQSKGSTYTEDDIKDKMVEMGFYDTNNQAVVEATIVVGDTVREIPVRVDGKGNRIDLGYKVTQIQLSSGAITGYKKVSEVYGMKRVPLRGQAAIDKLIELNTTLVTEYNKVIGAVTDEKTEFAAMVELANKLDKKEKVSELELSDADKLVVTERVSKVIAEMSSMN